METKVMQVFYDANCLPYKDQARQVHYPVIGTSFTGASNTTQIRFYVNEIGGIASTTWVAVARLPSGKKLYKQLSVATDTSITPNEQYAYLDLSSAFLSEKGDLLISLNGYAGGVDIVVDEDSGLYTITGSPIIQATGSIKISVGYTPYMDSNYGSVDMLSVQEALALMSDKLNVYNGIVVVDDISIEIASNYDNGQMLFDKTHKVFYKRVSSSFVKQDLYSLSHTYSQSGSDVILTISLVDAIGNVSTQTITLTNYLASLTYTNAQLDLKADKSTTLAGYGITDAYTKEETNDLLSAKANKVYVDNQLELKADKSTTYTKTEVDNLIDTIKSGEVVLVNTTLYPTLQSFLASTGVEGTIYLYPINTSDLNEGYYRYVWETISGSSQWVSLGTTEIDLSDYYDKSDIDTMFANYYTQSQIDTLFGNYYTKTQIDTTLASYVLSSNLLASDSDISDIMGD